MKRLEKSVERTQRAAIKFLLGSLIAIILLIALFWGGHDLYVRWQERRLVRRAVSDIEHGNERDANLAARTVLELKPSSAAAARIMAQLAERAGDRSALEWRRKTAQLEPNSTDDALALARCALQFNDIPTAERALGTVDEKGKATAAYHAASAFLAQTRQQEEKADSEWRAALQLAPEEKGYQLQLGILRVHAADPERHTSGEAILKALRSDDKQRALATRALINEGVVRHENVQHLLELARDLQAYPDATWSDRFLYLDFLRALHDPQFSSYLTELEKSTATKPPALAALLSWMSLKNLSLLALDFAKTLPAEVQEKWPVPLALAEVRVQLKDWRQLELAAENAQWGRFEFLRHAYLARALRAQDKPAAAEHEWAAAMKGASDQSESLLLLVRPVSEWGWEAETTDILWGLSKHPEKQKEAFLALYQHYAKAADTQGLYRVLVRLSELDSTNLNVENNLAQIALLLNANPEEARRLAADVYHKSPSNPAYMTTFAYSLLTQGDTKNAARIMRTLTEDQLADPTISVYYGICLAAAKDEKARAYLDFGKKANLLPEEKALIEKALRDLDSRSKTQ